MKKGLFANSRLSIAIKLSFIAGLLTLLLLGANLSVFLTLESNMVSLIFDEYASKMDASIVQRSEQQREELKENVATHAVMIGNAAATFIYGYDKVSLQRMLEA